MRMIALAEFGARMCELTEECLDSEYHLPAYFVIMICVIRGYVNACKWD